MKKKHSVCHFRSINFLVVLLLFMGINSGLRAQPININLDGCVNSVEDLPAKVIGSPIGVGPITTSSSNGPVTLTIISVEEIVGGFPAGGVGCGGFNPACPAELTPIVASGITVTDNGPNISFTGNIPDSWAGHILRVVVQAQDQVGACLKTYNIPIVRRPIDIALVLDKSGSMAWNSGATVIPRWTALKTAVGLFMSNLESFDLPNGMSGDRIGLSFFDNAAVQPASGFPTALITTLGSTGSVNGNLTGGGAQTPGGGTAFGAGLQDGFGKLPADPLRGRIIIAFTDGEQNIPTTTHVNVSGGRVRLGVTNLNAVADPVKIYPIGIGSAGSLPAILNEISMSSEGGGLQISTEDGSTMSGTYGANFINILQNVLATGSPQIVDNRLSRFTGAGSISLLAVTASFEARDSFIVNKNIKKLVFNVLSNAPAFAIMSVMKDSIEYINNTIVGRMSTGIGFRSFTLDFDKQGAPAINSGGTWIIRTRSTTRDQYEVSLLVDDHGTRYTCRTDNSRLSVGKPINLSATFNFGGRALNNSTIQAMILKPGDDLGDLLATTSLKNIPVLPGDTSSVGIQKYLELLKDSLFVKKLLANKQLINLTYGAADSTYRGQFANTDVSGVYHVIFLIKSNDTLTGEVVRYQKNTVYVYFPEVDLGKSSIVLTTNANTQVTTLTFRPVGINGKFIGPGWGNTITVVGNNIKVDQVIDNGDGTYSLLIQGSTSEKVTVSIGGATIYEGALKNIGKGKGIGGSGIDINKLIHEWWFWALLLLILLIIIFMLRKKKNP